MTRVHPHPDYWINPHVDWVLVERVRKAHITRASELKPDRDSVVYSLHHDHGWIVTDIAETLHMSGATVRHAIAQHAAVLAADTSPRVAPITRPTHDTNPTVADAVLAAA